MMLKRILFVLLLPASCMLLSGFGERSGNGTRPSTTDTAKGLFDSEEVLALRLTGNVRELLNDRESLEPRPFPFRLSYTDTQGMETILPVEVRTRGHFRRMRENCTYPPLLIRFPDTGPHLTSVFQAQKKLKLVMPCAGEEYIVREWLVYRLYNLITPNSFKARLVKIQLVDERNKKTVNPVYGILLEEESQMAHRNQAKDVELKVRPQQTDTLGFITMSVFQYLIGNTDWSVEFLQNIKLIQRKPGAPPIPVAYDFDHAGIVSSPYARPAEQLQMSSIRERRYRGYCLKDLSVFQPVLALLNRLKTDIYKLYTDCPWLDEKYRKSTLRFLDECYDTFNNTREWQRDFSYPCDKNGTGNVIIKGLKPD